MNHYKAREQRKDGKSTGIWHFTCRNNNSIWPAGFCTDACTHTTPEEAEAHYKEYLLDTANYDRHMSNQQLRCRICNAWTQGYVTVDSTSLYVLCDEHRNREALVTLVNVGETWSTD